MKKNDIAILIVFMALLRKRALLKSMMQIYLIILVLLNVGTTASAATYYVDGAFGNDSRTALQAQDPATPWRTIGKSASTMIAGDTCVVAAGTYEESVVVSNSGINGAPIIFTVKPENTVIVRRFNLDNKSYIKIIGFEITHNSTAYTHGIVLHNATHCEILNNTIHHVNQQAIRNNQEPGHQAHYNVLRGNKIYLTGCPAGVSGQCSGASGQAINLHGSHNLIEYNDISHPGDDFFSTFGSYNIIRNNYAHDYADSDFPDGTPNETHVDFWQPFSETGNLTKWNIVENNFAEDVWELNSHFFQLRNESTNGGMSDILIRGNVGVRFGSYVAQFGGVDYTRMYNNTFADFFYNQPKENSVVSYSVEPPHTTDDPSTNNANFNNIYYKTSNSATGKIIFVDSASGCNASSSNNACEQSGSHPSCIVTSGINFTDYANDDLHLQSSSNALNNGKAITMVTSASGSGNSFAVANAGFFSSGFGIITGDAIKVGSNNTVTITNIDYATNIIIVDSSISWSYGDSVVLSYQNVTPAIGAYEYKSHFSYEINLEQPIVVSPRVVQLAATVTNPDNVRFVEFYVDNIPMATVSYAPFVYNWNLSDTAKNYCLTARAYALLADKQLFKNSILKYKYSGLIVDSPNGGGNWQKGTTQSILWIHNDLSGNLNIELYQGEDKVADIGTAAVSAGSYVWAVDNGLADGNDYRVRIYQGEEEDYSDKAFSISSGVSSYVVKFYSSSGGSVSGTLNQTIAAGGSTTPVTAVPNSGYSFSSWTGTNGFASSSNPLTLTNVQYDMSITAHFSYVASGVVADFDNNAVTDLVWRHYAVDGGNVLWLMNAATAGTVAGEGDNEVEAEENNEVQGAGLKVEGEEENRGNDREGYFVGAGYYPAQDEVADIHESTLPEGEGISTEYPESEYGGPFGAINIMSKVSLPALANNSWKICGTGDFNNDGYQDILWRYYGTGGSNAVWLMEGTNRLSSVAIPAQTDLKWEMVGTGDFNNDKKVDILWRHKGNGKNMVWLMNGLTRSSIVNLPTQTNLTWKIVGCGDFNGDQKVDILWRFQGAGGKNQVWLMNGTVRQSAVNIKAETNVKWQIAGVGDFNQDGKPDIIWRNYSTGGANRIWLMNNTAYVRTETLPAVTDLTWKIEN